MYSQTTMKTSLLLFLLIFLGATSCKKDDETPVENPTTASGMYFPPATGIEWDTTSFAEAGWDTSGVADLYNFLELNGTRAFMILKNGKIVSEKYWGNDILNIGPFTVDTKWYWASAGKTLTAFLVGVAQNEGLLNIEDKTSDYLGTGWTNEPTEKENLILIKNQLTMTTGLDYNTGNIDCTDPECLQYKADAGTQWYYHNAPYTLLESVISNAAGTTFNDFTDQRIETKIGMEGTWIPSDYNNVYWSTARDAARFGLLLLNTGVWETDSILNDPEYFDSMTNSSQNLNPSYGFLTWLNGKESTILPGLPFSFNTSISPNAPTDLFAAMGKNGQFVDVIPSKNMVVIRMGEAPDNALVPVLFHDEMWQKLNMLF